MSNKTDRAESVETLRNMLRPGDAVTCTVMHVSKSGMSRSIMLQVPGKREDGTLFIRDISWLVAKAIGERFDSNNGGVVMTGCGMNMCFAAVYNLGRVLFPDGFGILGERQPPMSPKKARPNSPKHAAQLVRTGYKFRGRNGDTSGWDTDGGYALDYRG